MPQPVFIYIKSITGLLLISSLFLHASCRLGVLAWFYLNRPYIAAELCINRFEPASDCSGSCQLNSRLNLLGEEKETLPDYLRMAQEIVLWYSDHSASSPLQPFLLKEAPEWPFKTLKHDFNMGREIFEPPRILLIPCMEWAEKPVLT